MKLALMLWRKMPCSLSFSSLGVFKEYLLCPTNSFSKSFLIYIYIYIYICMYVCIYVCIYWSLVNSQCCVNFCCISKWFSYNIYTYTHTHTFFSTMVYHRILNVASCAIYNRTLLFIHPIYNSLYLLVPNSQPIPPPPKRFLITALVTGDTSRTKGKVY